MVSDSYYWGNDGSESIFDEVAEDIFLYFWGMGY